jgi:membrane protease YdiL (CAAX protease family)
MNTSTAPRFPLAVRGALTVLALFGAILVAALVQAVLPGGFVGIAGASAVVSLVALGLAVVLVRFVDRRPVRELGLTAGRPAASGNAARSGSLAVRGSLVGLVLVGTCVAVATGLAVAADLTVASRPGGGWAPEHSVAVILVQAFLLQGFPEELLFRGYLVQTATGRVRVWAVIALSTLLFGSLHLLSDSGSSTVTQRVLYLGIPLGFGALATVLRLATGSVWPAVAVHGGFHVSVYVAFGFVRPLDAGYGAFVSIYGGTLLLAAALLTLWAARTGRLRGHGSPN